MRIVESSDQVVEAIRTAQSEAQRAFGSDEVYLERYLSRPRHIEFQILADQNGNVLHLGERECSIQRRHQKLLEECPSPLMTPEMRESLGSLVSRAVASIQYVNAGTIEFLFDDQGNYYFIEMNTRIQVEHPVTEKVTGIDLIKQQIRIAAGEALSIRQEDVTLRGHSSECRINAESPRTFKPSPGQISAYHAPGGPGIRVDSMAYAGMDGHSLLRFDDRQADCPWLRPKRGDQTNGSSARHVRDRRNRDHDFPSQEDHCPSRLSGGSTLNGFPGVV